MNRRVHTLLAALVLVLVVHPAVSYAQTSAFADVAFKFVAAGKDMAPGKYELRLDNDRSAFTLVSPSGSGEFLLTVTRLAASEPPSSDTRFVFDKVGDTYYLSEVWLPGEDGYLLYAAKEKHTHRTVKGSPKKMY